MSEQSSGIRAAALRHLTRELASRRFWTHMDQRDILEDSEDASAVMEPLVAIGALSAEEAADWRARLERATAPSPEPDADLRTRAAEHLNGLAARLSGTGESDEAGTLFSGAVAAFEGAGLISRKESMSWTAALRDEPASEEWNARIDGLTEAPDFDDTVFQRAVLGPDRRVAGLRVTTVELYDGGVVVNWHYAGAAGETPEADALWARLDDDEDSEDPFGEDMDDDKWFDQDTPFALRDDIGTRYFSAGGGYGVRNDQPRVADGHESFAPSVPRDARYLEVVIDGEPIRIDLAG